MKLDNDKLIDDLFNQVNKYIESRAYLKTKKAYVELFKNNYASIDNTWIYTVPILTYETHAYETVEEAKIKGITLLFQELTKLNTTNCVLLLRQVMDVVSVSLMKSDTYIPASGTWLNIHEPYTARKRGYVVTFRLGGLPKEKITDFNMPEELGK